jgi:hypothetical protein
VDETILKFPILIVVGLENGEENATGKPSSSSKGSLLGTAFSTEQLQALLHKKSTHEAEADQVSKLVSTYKFSQIFRKN